MSEPAQAQPPPEPAEGQPTPERAENRPTPEQSQPMPEPAEGQPTPEQYAERARRADKASRGALAGVLGLEAVVVLLIPRTIAFTTGLGPVRTGICIGLAVVFIIAAGLVRRPWGIGLGSVLQLAFFATGALIATMFLVAALFAAVWLRLLLFRHEVVGRPGGLRMLLG